MKNHLLLIFLFLLPLITLGKVVTNTFTPGLFFSHNKFYYLGKMDYGIGFGNITAKLHLNQQLTNPQEQHVIKIGILIDQKYDQFHESQSCQQKESLLHSKQQILLHTEPSQTYFEIQQTIREHLWYVFAFNCEVTLQKQRQNFDVEITFQLTMFNNGSHFGEDQQIFYFYIVLAIVSVVLCIISKLSRDDSDWTQKEYPRYFLNIGIVLLMMGLIAKDGQGIFALEVISTMKKALSQSITMTILITLGLGWSINYFKCQYYQLIIPIGGMVAFIHMLLTPLSNSLDGDLNEDHHYDHVVGNMILYYRTIALVVLLVGSFKTYTEAHSNIKPFLRRFIFLSVIYASSQIFGVIFCQAFLPKYLQQQVMMAISDIGHLLASSGVLYMLSSTKSQYIQLRQTDENNQNEDKIN